ncbi:hypothetical protein PG996_012886 [Apiospora saccharicola]|uniref:Transposase n=1 Tax=Apiospora saccharicola TaxID=335842 RepID=A0ABR1U6C5_9PEZI
MYDAILRPDWSRDSINPAACFSGIESGRDWRYLSTVYEGFRTEAREPVDDDEVLGNRHQRYA